MATHDDIGLSQPAASTTTHRLDAISLNANSTVVLREVMVVGSPETTNALAQVLGAAPASTDWGLVTRVVGYSTTVSVAAMPAGSSGVTINAIAGPVSTGAPGTGDTGVIVRQVGYSTIVTVAAMPAGSTSVTVAAITGPVSTGAPTTSDTGVIVRQVGYSTIVSVAAMPANSSLVQLNAIAAGYLSTAAAANNSSALLVRVVGGVSTAADFVSNVSSVAGVVTVTPNSTAWVKNAGLAVDSSNALLVSGNSASTIVSVSSVSGLVTVAPQGTSNSSIYFPVRLTNGTAFLAPAVDYLHGSTLTASSAASTVGGPVSMLRASAAVPAVMPADDMFVVPWATLNGAQVVSVVTSSGASVMDSTNTALKVNVVAGATAGPTSTAAPSASDTGLIVRQVGYSTVVSVAALPANSSLVSLTQIAAGYLSTAAAANNSSAINVRVVGGPSTAADFASVISSVAGVVSVSPNSTAWVKNAGLSVDSSNFLNVNASFTGSTTVTVASFASALISSAVPAGNSSALHVRIVGGLATDSGASVMDSTTIALKVNVVAGATAGPTSTAAPSASDTGLIVRQVGYSTTVSVAALPAGSTSVTVAAITGPVSTAAPATSDTGVVVRVVGYSTVVSVAALPAGSTTVTIAGNSTAVIAAFPSAMVSTLAAAPGSSALLVREVASSQNSTSINVLSSNSTALYAVLSSAATAQRVHAYFVSVSTATAPSTIIFMSGSTNHVWGFIASSLVWGAHLAVSPPSELFRAAAGEALNVVIQNASTQVNARISVSWRADA